MKPVRQYFKLTDDLRIQQRWHLRAPVDDRGQEVDPWQFCNGRGLEPQGVIRFPVKPTGQALDFTLASFSIPVVHSRCVQLFERMGVQEVQFLPVQVEDHAGPYFILNPLRVIRCIDDARCDEVQYWKPEDGEPDKVGTYRVVAGLRIDSSKAGDAHIFRPWGWTVALIVSEELRRAMEREGVTGPKFSAV
jgi:hypothetical protein